MDSIYKLLFRLGVFVMWPMLSLLILTIIATITFAIFMALVVAWISILFMPVKKSLTGKYSIFEL